MREVHGVADTRKITAVRDNNCKQQVRVIDGDEEVRLALSECSYPAGLSPEQARFIAKCLVQSASRVEKKVKT